MTQSGGSATMNGVLYQLLGTAHWAGQIRLIASTTGDGEWTDAQILIEPLGGGGDTRIESPRRRIVEQWKSKSDGGAWSLRKIISDVLPDLYRAVDLTKATPETEFRFVTEGHRGHWEAAEQFFAELGRVAMPDDPLAALDDIESVKFFPDAELTKRAFFRHILDSLRSHQGIATDSERECARKLWYLLARFRMRGDQAAEKLTHELDGFLRPLVDYSEEVEPKRRELCAALLELASDGNATFTPQDMLAKVNLDHTSFCDWATARDSLSDTAQRTLRNRWRYCVEADVRSPMRPPANSLVCVLTGESGQGKTWRLASLALTVLADGSAAVVVSATGDASDDLQRAADTVRCYAYDRKEPWDLDLLAKKRSDFLPSLPTPWLTICVDDVQSVSEAKALVEQAWSYWGIRLVMTALPPVAQALKTQYGQEVSVIEIEDFNVHELRRYLEVEGHNWGILPIDVRTILRRPLLAKLYCDIAEGENWRPTDEYALFSRYWRRIRDDRDQADHPGDIEAMRQLASTFLRADVAYPWSQSECVRCGASSEVQRRLESIGWLRRLDDNRVEVTHDRLLSWAVAEAIVAKRISQELSVEEVARQLSAFCDRTFWSASGRMLAYVPMDVCWLMIDPGKNLLSDVSHIIEALEDKKSIWYSAGLYKSLLPTLGPRIIGPMVERVRSSARQNTTEDKHTPYPGFLSAAIIQIGKEHPGDAAEWGRRMFDDECTIIRQAGLHVLKHYPSTAVLEKLWQVHKANHDVYVRQQGNSLWVDWETSFAAMSACIRLNPEWLERRIVESAPGTEPFSELAYLVASLRGTPGMTMWGRVKAALFAKVPAEKPRCLVTCIQRYADSAEIPRLEAWVGHEADMTREVALATLVYLAPERAIQSLPRFSANSLYFTRTWWRPGLMLRFPKKTRDQIRGLIETSTEPRWRTALVYQDDPNQMDAPTLTLLLNEMETLVSDAASPSVTDRKEGLWVPLQLLADVTRSDLVSQFEARAGSSLEEKLSDLACSWCGRMSRSVDHELQYATRVLMKIAGDGLTKVVNMQLASTNMFSRLDGIKLSLIRPDSETRRLLADITRSSDYSDDQNSYPLLQAEATNALAALGENRAVVDSILRWGIVFLLGLPDMRAGQLPMTDSDLTGAIEALDDPDEKRRTNAVFALSISGRTDFASRVRQVLKHAEPESELALAAVVALDHFEDASPEAMGLLEKQLTVPNHAVPASLALLRNGKSESLAILEKELRCDGITPGVVLSDLLAVNLGMRQQTRKTVAELLWKHIQENNGQWLGMTPSFECLLEVDCPEVREFLIEEAFAPDHAVHVVGRKVDAIRALAKVDRDSAFRAAETVLLVEHDDTSGLPVRNDAELFPGLLIELDEARGIKVLIDAYARGPRALVKWAIGRALRRASDQGIVHAILDQMLRAESPETRIQGVELVGWQPPEMFGNRIRKVAVTDPDAHVRQIAENAVMMVERHEFAIELLRLLEETQGSRCWSYLEAIGKLCDPWLLTTRGDSLFLWDRLRGKTAGLRLHADRLIEERMEHVKDQADKADRDRAR